jgi:hypothetical protein
MKTILLSLAVLVAVAATSPAEVYIYKNKIKYTATGGGGSEKLSATGWTVINDVGEVTQVLAFPAQKKFAIIPMQSIEFNTVDGGAGKQYTFFIQRDIWTDGDGNTHIDTGGAKGLNTAMTVNGNSREIPKSYTWAGRSMYPADSSGILKFEESSGSFTFDKKWTETSNAAADDLNAAAQRLADDLLLKGYVDFSTQP